MPSLLNDPQLEQWFQRLNAPLKRLPVGERAALNLEVRQHVESLVAAHEELGSSSAEACNLALAQFGDPTQIGRKMYQEWQQSRTGFNADMGAGITGTALVCGLWSVIMLWYSELSSRLYSYGIILPAYRFYQLPFVQILVVGGLLLTAIVIGRDRPLQAMKTALQSSIWAAYFWGFSSIWGILSYFPHTPSGLIAPLFLLSQLMPLCVLGFCAIAYLASVTKRGWYKPSLADFKMAPFPADPAAAGMYAWHPRYRSPHS